jgi:hypothetical protein
MVKGEKDVAKAWSPRRRLVRCDLDDDSLRRVIALDLRLTRRPMRETDASRID